MIGVFMALDYVLFYVFWEISLVPMYLLIGIWGGQNRSYASIKFFIYTLIGSVAMLLAILATYFATGTFDIIQAATLKPFMDLPRGQRSLADQPSLLGLFSWALPSKCRAFPSTPGYRMPIPKRLRPAVSSWPVCCSNWARMVFCALFCQPYPSASQIWSLWIVALGAIAIVYGAFVCVAQTDFKRLIAYSSVSHMGYVMLGIGAAASVLTPKVCNERLISFTSPTTRCATARPWRSTGQRCRCSTMVSSLARSFYWLA